MKTVEIGDIIKLTSKEKKVVNAVREKIDIMGLAFETAAFNLQERKKELRALIIEYYPETQGFNISLSPEDEILITGREDTV